LSIYKEEAIVNIRVRTVRAGSSPEIKAIVSGLQRKNAAETWATSLVNI